MPKITFHSHYSDKELVWEQLPPSGVAYHEHSLTLLDVVCDLKLPTNAKLYAGAYAYNVLMRDLGRLGLHSDQVILDSTLNEFDVTTESFVEAVEQAASKEE